MVATWYGNVSDKACQFGWYRATPCRSWQPAARDMQIAVAQVQCPIFATGTVLDLTISSDIFNCDVTPNSCTR